MVVVFKNEHGYENGMAVVVKGVRLEQLDWMQTLI